MGELVPEAMVAEKIGVPLNTLRYWRSQRRIEFVKLGRHVLYTPDAVTELIARNTHKPSARARRKGE